MTHTQKILVAFLGLILTGVVAIAATETRERFFDGGHVRVVTGTTDVDVSASDYEAGFVTLLTIAPAESHVMHDTKLVLDLDKATTGFNDVATGTVTATFALSRKVDGTNWRTDIADVTTAITGTAAASRALTFDLGTITPDQDLRLEVTIGDEATSGDMEFPYFLTYRAGAAATVTEVAN